MEMLDCQRFKREESVIVVLSTIGKEGVGEDQRLIAETAFVVWAAQQAVSAKL